MNTQHTHEHKQHVWPMVVVSVLLLAATFALFQLNQVTRPQQPQQFSVTLEVAPQRVTLPVPKVRNTPLEVGDKIYLRTDAQRMLEAELYATQQNFKQLENAIATKEAEERALREGHKTIDTRQALTNITDEETVEFTETIVKEFVMDEVQDFIDDINMIGRIGKFVVQKVQE